MLMIFYLIIHAAKICEIFEPSKYFFDKGHPQMILPNQPNHPPIPNQPAQPANARRLPKPKPKPSAPVPLQHGFKAYPPIQTIADTAAATTLDGQRQAPVQPEFRAGAKPECFFQIATDFEPSRFFSVSHSRPGPPTKWVPGAVTDSCGCCGLKCKNGCQKKAGGLG